MVCELDSKSRVLGTLDFKPVDRIAKYDTYWGEFADTCRSRLNIDRSLDLADYFGVDIAIAVPDESPYPGRRERISCSASEEIGRNGYGVTERTKQGSYFSEELAYLIADGHDLDQYPFESPSDDARYTGFVQDVQASQKKGKCVFGKIGGPYIRSSFIRGQENFLMDIAGDPGFARELASRVGAFLLEIAKEQVKRANLFDTGIWIFDDMAYNSGPMMSPAAFEQIFYPIYKKIVKSLKDFGVRKVGLHSDGDIRQVLDMLVDTGIDLINPVEPRTGMSIQALKKKYGRRLAYVGGMCNSDILINGPVSLIERKTMEILELASDGGVIIGSHSIGPDIPVEHYLAYIQCIEKNGTF